jgi:hypothetical protein
MTVLIVVTLVYAAILVLALAASLTAILVYLVRINRELDGVRNALASVPAAAEPLGRHLEPLEEPLDSTVEALEMAEKNLARAADVLAIRLQPSSRREPSAEQGG